MHAAAARVNAAARSWAASASPLINIIRRQFKCALKKGQRICCAASLQSMLPKKDRWQTMAVPMHLSHCTLTRRKNAVGCDQFL
jgi:hypothetical protein